MICRGRRVDRRGILQSVGNSSVAICLHLVLGKSKFLSWKHLWTQKNQIVFKQNRSQDGEGSFLWKNQTFGIFGCCVNEALCFNPKHLLGSSWKSFAMNVPGSEVNTGTSPLPWSPCEFWGGCLMENGAHQLCVSPLSHSHCAQGSLGSTTRCTTCETRPKPTPGSLCSSH